MEIQTTLVRQCFSAELSQKWPGLREEGIEALLSEDFENQLQVQAKLALISTRLKEVGALDSLYLEADQAGQDSLWLIRGQLLDTLAALALETSRLNEAVNHQRSLSAASLIGQNANIETPEVYEENLKTVNDIYLNYLMEGLGEMPVEDLGALEGIAQQCPLEGGHAVFQARALLAVATRQIPLYDDDTACGGEEGHRPSVPIDAQRELEEKVWVYPNPAKEYIVVDWTQSENQVVAVELLDIYGKTLQKTRMKSGSQNYLLLTSGLNGGLYIVRLQLHTGDVAKKIIITH